MKFLVCKKMYGEGCDYTIGCGMRFDFIETDSITDAQEKTIWPDGRDESSSLVGEMSLSKILLIPAEYVTEVDVPKIAEEIEAKVRQAAENKKEQKERTELQRLQAKYNQPLDSDAKEPPQVS